ncbi:uridine kinase [Mammaliicoccus sciuri]|uniref:uridine kinase family protein n=1 Tax=Mammaliicoccus sciuri TaxID=1296 RepID=UPI001F36EECE|nr:AAA family ATPase [Mammaliicoccus sciuri]
MSKGNENMNAVIEEIVGFIKRSNHQIMIRIGGHVGSGKSTFCQELIKCLDPKDYNMISTDTYIVNSNLRKHTKAKYMYNGVEHEAKVTACMPEAHNVDILERDIRALHNGIDIMTIETPWQQSERLDATKKVTILEGMTTTFIDSKWVDLSIYIYTDNETELKRRFDRDVHVRGIDIEFLKASQDERRIQFELFMHPLLENFDIVIDHSNDLFKILKNQLN